MLLHFVQKSPGDYVPRESILQALGIPAEGCASEAPQVSLGLGSTPPAKGSSSPGLSAGYDQVPGCTCRVDVLLRSWQPRMSLSPHCAGGSRLRTVGNQEQAWPDGLAQQGSPQRAGAARPLSLGRVTVCPR